MARAKRDDEGGRTSKVPLKPYETILEQEIVQAVHELKRPLHGLIMTGLLAGFGIGVSVLLKAVVITELGGPPEELAGRLLVAGAYAIGFIIVVLGSTDLFTEYTTLAILPILTGDAPIRQLGRFSGIIFGANLVGGIAFAGLVVILGPGLEATDVEAFHHAAGRLVELDWWTMLLSAFLAGWLMGFLSWLIAAGKETTSQVFFTAIIAGTIGFVHLHHSIVGAIEVATSLFLDAGVTAPQAGHFMLWTTIGNIVGGVLLAVMIRYGALQRETA